MRWFCVDYAIVGVAATLCKAFRRSVHISLFSPNFGYLHQNVWWEHFYQALFSAPWRLRAVCDFITGREVRPTFVDQISGIIQYLFHPVIVFVPNK